MGWDYWDWQPRPPRRPANGIRAQSKRFGQTWWAGRWLAALERLVDPGRLQRGRSYARSGQVLNIDIRAGHVSSAVQGSRFFPYEVSIRIKPLSDKDWKKVADAMASQAIFAARLLAGEMPQNIEEAFAKARVNLFPGAGADLETECSCPDDANPCKHISAVYYLLGEQFEADPFLIFRLRGKTKNEIIKMLRERRAGGALTGETAAIPAAKRKAKAAKAPALDKCLDRFWTAEDDLADFHVTIQPPPVDAAPVKRLGVPAFWREARPDLGEMMTTAYHAITEASIATALGTNEPGEKTAHAAR